ncbi:FAD binding domain-containing protein [Amycolatopsis sp. CA-128772]|uniref:FAD binding domain-containing protein n=1 Tax=Amycolatopsis sp. CA-128772 TaxID=2073159 RepID=UPI000CD2F0F9|nr:FAD binding domain-containing protein [Amycolatopsis sp. CA-128772]
MIRVDAPRRLLQPRSVDEAMEMLAEHPDAVIVAGGTLAVPAWRAGPVPETALCLGAIRELAYTAEAGCGALCSLREIAARHPDAAWGSAAASIGGPALRELATVGGNVVAASPGCVAVALLVAEAHGDAFDLRSRRRIHRVPLVELFINRNLLLLSLNWAPGGHTAFAKAAVRAAGGPNIASVAVRRTAARAAVAVGMPGRLPARLPSAEKCWLAGEGPAEVAAQAAAELTLNDDAPDTRHGRAVAATLVRRLIVRCEGRTADVTGGRQRSAT